MTEQPGMQRDIDELIAWLATFPGFDPADPFGDRRRTERRRKREAA